METVQISARIDPALKRAVEDCCRSSGTAMNHFVQEALMDRLEELEDIDELGRIRHEPTRSLADLLGELGLDGRDVDR